MSSLRSKRGQDAGALQERSPNVAGRQQPSRRGKRSYHDSEDDEQVEEPLTPVTKSEAKKGLASKRRMPVADSEGEEEYDERLPTPITTKKGKKSKAGWKKKRSHKQEGLSEGEEEFRDEAEAEHTRALIAEKEARVQKILADTGLRHIGPGDTIRGLDWFDPESFEQIDGGDPDAKFQGSTLDKANYSEKAAKDCLHILEGRRESIDTNGVDPNVYSAEQARTLQERPADEIWHDLEQYVLSDILASFGRPEFETEHVQEMAGFTARYLKLWIVYFGFVEYHNGHVEAYCGRSLAANGSGGRVVGNYEQVMRHKAQGTFSAHGESGFGRAMLDKEVKQVYLRPFAVFPIPEDEALRRKMEKLVAVCEGVGADLAQCVSNRAATTFTIDRDIDVGVMLQQVKAVAPKNRIVPWQGINKISPYVQGVTPEPGKNKLQIQRLADLEEQGYECPVCGGDMKTAYDRHDVSMSCINPLWGKVDWCDKKVCCTTCWNWLDYPATLKYARENFSSMAELKEYRLSRIGWTGRIAKPRAPTVAESEGSCPVCKEAYVERTMSRKKLLAEGLCFAAAVMPKGIPCLESIACMCESCKDFLNYCTSKRYISAGQAAMKKEVESEDCTVERLGELKIEWSASKRKQKRSPGHELRALTG